MPLSFVTLLAAALAAILLYFAAVLFYRLHFHPLAGFPGPKLAAISNLYEFYYDVWLQGQFTMHLLDLHARYGPIIRISPDELHVNDPEFYDTLYVRAGRRDKYRYFSGRFGFASDALSTVDHETHRMRRKALSPMFSNKRIIEFQPVILAKLERLCSRLVEFEKAGSIVPVHSAMMALTTDIITEYAFAKPYDQLEMPNFENMEEALKTIIITGQFALHCSLVFPILDSLPDSFVLKHQPVLAPVVGLRRDLGNKVKEIREGINQGYKHVAHPTIFHEVLNSDLPEAEKTDARLGDEAQLVIAAGLLTTSWALTVASFHLSTKPAVLAKLRAELGSKPDLNWHKLETLPYLTGCVRESIRLAHGLSSRSPRLAPDTELTYKDWVIPKNTPVSMTNVHILMNEDIHPEPKEFKPERWIGNPELERFFVPFTKGSRQCLGLNLAQAEMYLAMALIFTRFDFELYETDISDIEMKYAYMLPYPKWDSKGVRAHVKSV